METRMHRRGAIAAAVTVSALALTTAADARPNLPERSEPALDLPGIEAITRVAVAMMVFRGDAATEVLFELTPGAQFTEIAVSAGGPTPDAFWRDVTIQGDTFHSLPVWLQRELGYAALAARDGAKS